MNASPYVMSSGANTDGLGLSYKKLRRPVLVDVDGRHEADKGSTVRLGASFMYAASACIAHGASEQPPPGCLASTMMHGDGHRRTGVRRHIPCLPQRAARASFLREIPCH